MVVVKPAIATAGSRRRDARAFGQWLERNGGGHQRKDAARSYGVDDVRLDFDVPTGAAALAGVSAAVRCVKRKAPPPHTPSIGRPADHNSERRLQNRNLPPEEFCRYRRKQPRSGGRETCCRVRSA